MNIALFASQFYPHIGGVEELCRQLAHAYNDLGIHTIVLTNRWPRSLPEFEEYEGIPVYRLAMRAPEGSLKARVNYLLTHRSLHASVLKILRSHQIDLMHVQCVSANGFYALCAKRAMGLPLLVTTQGERTMDAGRVYERSAFQNGVLRDLLVEADYVTACSQATLSDVETYYNRPLTGRSEVIYNGIRLSEFTAPAIYPHPRPYAFAIGRLVAQKGFDLLIDAFAQADIASHDLLIAGEGPEHDALQGRIRERGLDDRVTLVGRANREMAVALFSGCSLFVLPSRQEPQGIVTLEAMAAARAVIATRVGGVPEIVTDGVTGLLVPGSDVGALASAITRLAADEPLRRRLGEAARAHAQNFDWSAIAERYLTIYRKLLA